MMFETKVYGMGKNGGLELLKPKEVEIGTVLHWGGNMGFPATDYVVADVIEGHGSKIYRAINLETGEWHHIEAFNIKDPTDEVWHKQWYFTTDKRIDGEELVEMIKRADGINAAKEEEYRRKEEERNRMIEKGRTIVEAQPFEVKAVIMAYYTRDESDAMYDYFGHSDVVGVCLGFSKTTRRNFNEMRKFAAKFGPTKHLAVKNKEYEHRENYTGGYGYYLKDAWIHRTGWRVEKEYLRGDIYYWIGKYGIMGEYGMDEIMRITDGRQ